MESNLPTLSLQLLSERIALLISHQILQNQQNPATSPLLQEQTYLSKNNL